jgi:ribonucleoside-diphosphate reductase alpha chain
MRQFVVKSDGRKEEIKFDKITQRIKKQCRDLNKDYVVPTEVTRRVAESVVDGITTAQIDELIAQEAARMVTVHPDYSVLGARILMSRWQKSIPVSFSENVERLYDYVNPDTGLHSPLVSPELVEIVSNKKKAELIDRAIVHDRDHDFDYFGLATLRRGYLKSVGQNVAETPQFMWMRVALGIHGSDVSAAIQCYDSLSKGLYIHATPTLFNAGTPRSQMASCFLQSLAGDSIEGIFETYKQIANISKWAGGIGLHIHNLRAAGTMIAGTNGTSDGIIPMVRVLNEIARYVNQGGKRKGAFSVYLEPWHADIEEFLDLKKNHGKEELRARDLFYALWTPDLFMQRVKDDGIWSLMCPHKSPGLSDVHGEEFVKLYEQYEAEGRYVRQVKARDLWVKVVTAQIETGVPYILYKDAANAKSNQKNLGTIKSSNLCTEIIEYSDPNETAVCNLASIALPRFVKDGKYDFDALQSIASEVTKNLNHVIDKGFYPTEQTNVSNLKHRPIGIGVQGLADTFALLGYNFEDENARELNRRIFATIYYGALEASCELARHNGAYESYEGSPSSEGILQFDMWGVEPHDSLDWKTLKKKIKRWGLRNSLLLAPMPTASTSQILGNNECFEPFTSNLYVRRVLSGEFVIINRHLVNDLVDVGLWNEEMKNEIVRNYGSVQSIPSVPDDIKRRYRTVWEMSMKPIIDMAADRGAYICQSQSMNLFIADPTIGKVNAMHFYAWESGLKTGMYYLRSKPAAMAKTITVESKTQNEDQVVSEPTPEEIIACSLENPEACDMCGS